MIKVYFQQFLECIAPKHCSKHTTNNKEKGKWLNISSLHNIVLHSFYLVFVLWRLFVTPKGLSTCDVIIVEKSSNGERKFSFNGWCYYFLLSSRLFNKFTLLGWKESILSQSCTKSVLQNTQPRNTKQESYSFPFVLRYVWERKAKCVRVRKAFFSLCKTMMPQVESSLG